MVSVRALDHAGRRADIAAGNGVFKFLDHLARAEGIAVGGGFDAGVLGVFIHERVEILAVGEPSDKLIGELELLRSCRLVGALGREQQDVLGAHNVVFRHIGLGVFRAHGGVFGQLGGLDVELLLEQAVEQQLAVEALGEIAVGERVVVIYIRGIGGLGLGDIALYLGDIGVVGARADFVGELAARRYRAKLVLDKRFQV